MPKLDQGQCLGDLGCHQEILLNEEVEKKVDLGCQILECSWPGKRSHKVERAKQGRAYELR